jgi:uncharacterized membrane protein
MMWTVVPLLNLSVMYAPSWTLLAPAAIIRQMALGSMTRGTVPFLLRQKSGQSPIGGLMAQNTMDGSWYSEPAWAILWIAVLAVFVVVAWYVGTKFRPKPVQKERPASEWLTKYKELHSRGVLSDEEFRTIKTKLAEQLQDELNDNGKEG